ncbi:histidine phosphatase superfamily [Calycina marina]|uniref:Histidine phosphatase superfamily n=1 Tax=Calycina marina TaxID=1763456 RepID=A0A9P7YX08_9HELO|nr:histidine phosphatase superfamily [Calycina marina]
MRLLLIRHGETLDNVVGNWAGTQDSALTTHGVIQTTRLGAHLASNGVKVSHIFSSDLQRASRTAQAIGAAQDPPPPHVKLESIREQDFGWWEGKTITKGAKNEQRLKHCLDEGFRDIESKESMKARAKDFISTHLMQHLHDREDDETVAVVAHGIILSYLWRTLLKRFDAKNVTVGPTVILGDRGVEYMGGWSNTGYLDLEVKRVASSVSKVEADTAKLLLPVADNLKDIASRFLPTNHFVPIVASHGNAASPRAADIGTGSISSPVAASAKSSPLLLVVKSVNNLEHLRGLKKTRGGIGSSRHDDKQTAVDSFFKRQKTK